SVWGPWAPWCSPTRWSAGFAPPSVRAAPPPSAPPEPSERPAQRQLAFHRLVVAAHPAAHAHTQREALGALPGQAGAQAHAVARQHGIAALEGGPRRRRETGCLHHIAIQPLVVPGDLRVAAQRAAILKLVAHQGTHAQT